MGVRQSPISLEEGLGLNTSLDGLALVGHTTTQEKIIDARPSDSPLASQADDQRTLKPPERKKSSPDIWTEDHHGADTQTEPFRLFSSNSEDGVGMSMVVRLLVGPRIVIDALIDTGANTSVMSYGLAKELGYAFAESDKMRVWGPHKAAPPEIGYHWPSFAFWLDGKIYHTTVCVAPIATEFLLGYPFLKSHGCCIDIARDLLWIGGQVIQCNAQHDIWDTHSFTEEADSGIQDLPVSGMTVDPQPLASAPPTCSDSSTKVQAVVRRVIASRRVVIPPCSARFVKIKVEDTKSGQRSKELEADQLLQPVKHRSLDIPYSLLPGEGDKHVLVRNSTMSFQTVKKGKEMGSVVEFEGILENLPTATPDLSEATTEPSDQAYPALSEKTEKLLSTVSPKEMSVDTLRALVVELPDHLRDLFIRSCDLLTEDQAKQLSVLLFDYKDTFSSHDLDIGKFTGLKHRILTREERPVTSGLRRTPLGFEGEEENHLDQMLAAGVIRPSQSEWSSAPVLIRKKDGSMRWCIDYRKLNDVTVKDVFPLPLIKDCLDTLSGTEFFSTLDLSWGYWQIAMDERDQHKTAFITRYGLFEFTRMGFGLCNAPSTFMRAMYLVLQGLTWKEVLAYIDDIIVSGKDFDGHLRNLRTVFERFRCHNLKLKPRKCLLFVTTVDYLGKVVSREGVAVDPKKVEVVLKWPTPTSTKEVQSFLGIVGYHRDFIKDLSEVADCLFALFPKGVPFEWNQERQTAFETLKERMAIAPVLKYPDPKRQFILDVDASNVAIGAELIQELEGLEHVVCYGSFRLTPLQRRYCTTRRELLAVVRFTRQFRHYLLGGPFIVRTDHNSLTWLMRFKAPQGQLARWIEELSQYDMLIQHRKGKEHVNADALSRMPDDLEYCDNYRAGVYLDSLPCHGCSYCTRAHEQWSRFEEEVDDVVPLTVKSHL